MYYNIVKGFLFLQIVFFIFATSVFSQQTSYIRPDITDKWKEYRKQVKADSNKKMVELQSAIPGMVYDLRYATSNNFMHRLMYPSKTRFTFLRLVAVKALQNAQSKLHEMGLGLKVFDAYRPYAVTEKFWELVHDERYVANPARGSGHNRGTSVDLTIFNLNSGLELDMGTGFDNFTDTAHHSFTDLPESVLQNRLLLKSTMEQNGFKALETEWWHYSLPQSSQYELLNLGFKKLKRKL
ncbi:MAG TPA: M15 family metallopeptidase [Chitinophagaceae bacterium]|jgi:D-alanyl-D-alanine dipeptidase|nr:M15 family metallopeptidase [Chitinophagaceae bacterium]